MSNPVTAAGVTLQVRNIDSVKRFFQCLGLPLAVDTPARVVIDVKPVITLVPPFTDLAMAERLGWGVTIDLVVAKDFDEFFALVRERGCLITRSPGEASDGRYGFTFQIPDAGGYLVNVLRAPLN